MTRQSRRFAGPAARASSTSCGGSRRPSRRREWRRQWRADLWHQWMWLVARPPARIDRLSVAAQCRRCDPARALAPPERKDPRHGLPRPALWVAADAAPPRLHRHHGPDDRPRHRRECRPSTAGSQAILLHPLPGVADGSAGRHERDPGRPQRSQHVVAEFRGLARATPGHRGRPDRVQPRGVEHPDDGIRSGCSGWSSAATTSRSWCARRHWAGRSCPRRIARRSGAGRGVQPLILARQFGGDPSVVGRTVTINGRAFTVIGIAPPGFRGKRAALRPTCGCR